MLVDPPPPIHTHTPLLPPPSRPPEGLFWEWKVGWDLAGGAAGLEMFDFFFFPSFFHAGEGEEEKCGSSAGGAGCWEDAAHR